MGIIDEWYTGFQKIKIPHGLILPVGLMSQTFELFSLHLLWQDVEKLLSYRRLKIVEIFFDRDGRKSPFFRKLIQPN